MAEKYRGTENPEMAKAMRDLRRSSAASPHDSRPKRERSRHAARNAAVKDSRA